MSVREYLHRVAAEMRGNGPCAARPGEDWPSERRRRLAEYYEMMGVSHWMGLAERPPLNVTIVREFRREGYRVQVLHYESLPKLYVTANLYIPEPLERPVPGVLYLCGHQHPQKTVYQAHARRFAQLGFVCLIVETIQRGEIPGYHHGPIAQGWFHWYSRGYTPAGVELWNGVRGLDLLASLPEVDAAKLGVTGFSGGGAVTWWVAAADERVQAAAAVCGTYTFASWVRDRLVDTNCDCMSPINYFQWELADIGALVAPRPLMIVSSVRDVCFTAESSRDVFTTLRAHYHRLGAAGALGWTAVDAPHGYEPESCRAVYGWMLRHLQGVEPTDPELLVVDERPEVQESEETLCVFPGGIPTDERTTKIQDSFVPLAKPPEIATARELEEHRARVIEFLRARTFRHFPERPCPLNIDVVHDFRARERLGGPYGSAGTFRFQSEPGEVLRGEWWIPPGGAGEMPALVVLRSADERTRSGWNAGPTWLGVGPRDARWPQVFVETHGTGEFTWGANLQWYLRRAAVLTGRTIASVQVYDTLRALAAARSLPALAGRPLVLAGRGQMAAVALYAALLDPDVAGVLLADPPATQDAPSQPDGSGEAIEMLGCLRVTDLPQVAGMLWPREIVFLGERPESYAWAEALYARLGTPGAVRRVQALSEWQPGGKA